MPIKPAGLTIASAEHHRVTINGVELHYVTAGTKGTPVLLVHGFPESWWAFHRLIPLISPSHRVIAVDLRGFGDSGPAAPGDTSATVADDLHALIEHLNLGSIHLLVQDISGAVGLRLALNHADDILSLIGVETGFAGYGLELAADIARGGAWYIGPLTTPGVADTFFAGREVDLIGRFLLSPAWGDQMAIVAQDVDEFARGYARSNGWSGARTLYGSMLREGADLRDLVATRPLRLPSLAVERTGRELTAKAMSAVHSGTVRHAQVARSGHYIAQETAGDLANILKLFLSDVDEGGTE